MSAKKAPAWVDIERLTNTVPAPGWERYANCRGINPELFHPERGEPTDHIKAVCQGCPVVYACLSTAVATMDCVDVGIWGRTSANERRPIRRELNRRRRAAARKRAA